VQCAAPARLPTLFLPICWPEGINLPRNGERDVAGFGTLWTRARRRWLQQQQLIVHLALLTVS